MSDGRAETSLRRSLGGIRAATTTLLELEGARDQYAMCRNVERVEKRLRIFPDIVSWVRVHFISRRGLANFRCYVQLPVDDAATLGVRILLARIGMYHIRAGIPSGCSRPYRADPATTSSLDV